MRELRGQLRGDCAALETSVPAVKSLLVRARGGLVDATTARATECEQVRHEVVLACDRGVRSSGLVRRHLRDCAGCREYRAQLRGARRRVAALVPVGPLGVLLQTLGGGGTSAVAVGAGGTTAASTLGGAGVVLTATKVALVCAAAAVTAGGALATRPTRSCVTAR